MQLKNQELTSQLSEAALDETRVKELTEIHQELVGKIDEMNSLSLRLASSLHGKPPVLDSS